PLTLSPTPPTTLHTLSLHDALPISNQERFQKCCNFILRYQNEDGGWPIYIGGASNISASVKAYFALKLTGYKPDHPALERARKKDRKSTRLNSSHRTISYAVFCLKK